MLFIPFSCLILQRNKGIAINFPFFQVTNLQTQLRTMETQQLLNTPECQKCPRIHLIAPALLLENVMKT